MNDIQTDPEGSQASGGRSRRPALSTVIALLALVVALGTTAQALPGRNSVRSDDIKRGAVTTPKIRNGAVTAPKIRNRAVTPKKIKDHVMWALVDNGTLIQGSGVEAVYRDSAGIYQVRFVRSVRLRALSATIYNESFGEGQVNVLHCSPAHSVNSCALNPDFDGPDSAFVNTEDSAGANADRTFLVIAHPLSPDTQVFVPRTMRPRPRAEARG